MTSLLITAAVSYLLGSIPFGYVLVWFFRGQDVRQTGSGNIGATNVSRTSPVLGIATLLLDASKGMGAVALTRLFFPGNSRLAALAAVFAVIGHIFPVWMKFRGGKGVATGLGSLVLLAPKSIVVAAGVFVGLVALFRYVSLGSVVAVALVPVLAWFLDGGRNTPFVAALIGGTSLLIIAKHYENIRRLIAGTENKWGRR